MALFHANYLSKNVFRHENIFFGESFWYLLGRSVAILFILVSGISFFLSSENKNLSQIIKNTLRRCTVLTVIAWLISLVTYGFFYEERISWGIIHFFALASLCGLAFSRLWFVNVIIGIIFIILWDQVRNYTIHTNLLIPFGFLPDWYYSADYYPLIPWFWYYLIGHGLAYWLRKLGSLERVLSGVFPTNTFFAFVGKRALLVYLVHVPILYVLFLVFSN